MILQFFERSLSGKITSQHIQGEILCKVGFTTFSQVAYLFYNLQ